jgi:hypothetical protein
VPKRLPIPQNRIKKQPSLFRDRLYCFAQRRMTQTEAEKDAKHVQTGCLQLPKLAAKETINARCTSLRLSHGYPLWDLLAPVPQSPRTVSDDEKRKPCHQNLILSTSAVTYFLWVIRDHLSTWIYLARHLWLNLRNRLGLSLRSRLVVCLESNQLHDPRTWIV